VTDFFAGRWSEAQLDEFLDGARNAHVRVLELVSELSDEAASADSLLPGWTRAHVITHLARNADGQRRMLDAARRGVLVEQYPAGRDGRATEIEAGAGRAAAALVADLRDSCAALDFAWRQMTARDWERPTAARAGPRPAWQSAWARWREVEIHTVDLDVGFIASHWPRSFAELALHLVIHGVEGRSIDARLPLGAAIELRRSDIDRRWRFGDAGKASVVCGEPWALLAWVLGRLDSDSSALDIEGTIPALLPWA
jgi:maleylpyruvate isomerase